MAVTYSYKGILSNKYTEGQITALNKDEAAFKLKEDKIIITSLIKISGKEVKPKKEKEFKKAAEQVFDICKMAGLTVVWVIPGGAVLTAIILKFSHRARPTAFRNSEDEEKKDVDG